MASQGPTMEFKRGDDLTQYFQLPTDSWVAGGTLWFAAKPSVDNDNSDAAAVINKSFTDSAIVDNTDPEYLAGYVTYALDFIPDDIVNVSFSNGEKSKKYLGEFVVVSALGIRESFPANDQYLNVIIYADIKRGA